MEESRVASDDVKPTAPIEGNGNVTTQPSASTTVPSNFNIGKELEKLDRRILKQAILNYLKSEPSQEQKFKEVLASLTAKQASNTKPYDLIPKLCVISVHSSDHLNRRNLHLPPDLPLNPKIPRNQRLPPNQQYL